MPDDDGPCITAALFCEKVLDEKDGVLSVVRIVDRFNVGLLDPAPDTFPGIPLQVAILLLFRPGPDSRECSLEVVANSPSGKTTQVTQAMVKFAGGHRGVNVKGDLAIVFDVPGVHWFDVILDGQVKTRLPVEVVLQPITAPTAEMTGVAGEPAE